MNLWALLSRVPGTRPYRTYQAAISAINSGEDVLDFLGAQYGAGPGTRLQRPIPRDLEMVVLLLGIVTAEVRSMEALVRTGDVPHAISVMEEHMPVVLS